MIVVIVAKHCKKKLGDKFLVKSFMCVLFISDDGGWKEEKKTGNGDVVVSRISKKGNKIYRITAVVDVDAKVLSNRLSKMDDVTEWNQTLLKYELLRRINDQVAISYQVKASQDITNDIDVQSDILTLANSTLKNAC